MADYSDILRRIGLVISPSVSPQDFAGIEDVISQRRAALEEKRRQEAQQNEMVTTPGFSTSRPAGGDEIEALINRARESTGHPPVAPGFSSGQSGGFGNIQERMPGRTVPRRIYDDVLKSEIGEDQLAGRDARKNQMEMQDPGKLIESLKLKAQQKAMSGEKLTPAEEAIAGITKQDTGLTEFEAFVNDGKKRGLSDRQINQEWEARQIRVAGGKAEATAKGKSKGEEDSGESLTPEDITFMAEQVLAGESLSKVMPGYGNRFARLRAKVLHEMSRLSQEAGDTGGSQAARNAAYKANQTALSWTKRQQSAISSFEKTVRKQFDLIRTQMKKVPRGTSPLANKYDLYLRGNLSGDPETTALMNLVATTTAEYAKVMTGNIGASASTDSARAEAGRLLNAAFNDKQLSLAMDTMVQEMNNRTEGLQEQIDTIHDDMALAGPSRKPSAQQRPPLSSFEQRVSP